MKSHEYYAAHEPEVHTVLGVELKPFTLGHYILLSRLGNKIVAEDDKPGLDDLIEAVWVCALEYREAVDAIKTNSLLQRSPLARLFRVPDSIAQNHWVFRPWRVSVEKVAKRWQKKIGCTSLVDETKAFVAYMKDGARHPTVASVHGSGDNSPDCLPFVQRVKVALLSQTTLTEDQILNRSWSLCLWDYFTLKAIEGNIRFVDIDAIEAAQASADAVLEMVKKGEIKIQGIGGQDVRD
jgi:hypothetical protein